MLGVPPFHSSPGAGRMARCLSEVSVRRSVCPSFASVGVPWQKYWLVFGDFAWLAIYELEVHTIESCYLRGDGGDGLVVERPPRTQNTQVRFATPGKKKSPESKEFNNQT